MEAKLIIRDVDHPQGIWVRGHYQDGSQMEPEDPKGWVTGYYIMVGGGVDSDRHYVSLKQIQIEGDCTTACDNPPNQFDFDNPYELTITKRDGTLARDTWHTLVVEVCGNNIKAWLNGDQYIDHDDTIIPHLDGTVGLKTYKADTVSYDDIIVTPITCNP
jgi:hypothetical protein